MSRVGWYRAFVVGGAIALLEVLCLAGFIDKITMQAPHLIVRDLYRMLVSGRMNGAIAKTLSNTVLALVLSLGAGIIIGALLHRARALRDTLDPLFATYYAVPMYAFYPLLIVIFGLGDFPQVAIGFLLAVMAVIINTLNGLDRVPAVLLKTARVHGLGFIQEAFHIRLPYAAPYVFTGFKLAVAYSFIGVIGAEFITSSRGIGYEISFAYNNFDNKTMYPLILLILVLVTIVNMSLYAWERRLLARRTPAP